MPTTRTSPRQERQSTERQDTLENETEEVDVTQTVEESAASQSLTSTEKKKKGKEREDPHEPNRSKEMDKQFRAALQELYVKFGKTKPQPSSDSEPETTERFRESQSVRSSSPTSSSVGF